MTGHLELSPMEFAFPSSLGCDFPRRVVLASPSAERRIRLHGSAKSQHQLPDRSARRALVGQSRRCISLPGVHLHARLVEGSSSGMGEGINGGLKLSRQLPSGLLTLCAT